MKKNVENRPKLNRNPRKRFPRKRPPVVTIIYRTVKNMPPGEVRKTVVLRIRLQRVRDFTSATAFPQKKSQYYSGV